MDGMWVPQAVLARVRTYAPSMVRCMLCASRASLNIARHDHLSGGISWVPTNTLIPHSQRPEGFHGIRPNDWAS
jgi:hypothetical protein